MERAKFFILDYEDFKTAELPIYVREPFRHLESVIRYISKEFFYVFGWPAAVGRRTNDQIPPVKNPAPRDRAYSESGK